MLREQTLLYARVLPDHFKPTTAAGSRRRTVMATPRKIEEMEILSGPVIVAWELQQYDKPFSKWMMIVPLKFWLANRRGHYYNDHDVQVQHAAQTCVTVCAAALGLHPRQQSFQDD